jgi:hypothetical protein
MNGLNLNPLAPAWSKRSFVLSGKIRNSIEDASFQLPFYVLFCTFFEPFPEKSQKGSKVRGQSLKETPKWKRRVSKWGPGVTKLSPKDPESATNQQHVIQETRNGAPGATLELKVPTYAKHTQKTHPNNEKTHQNVPQGAKQERKTI